MKRIILTGGGTAGHVTPNIALLPRLKELQYDIHYIGSYNGIEKELIEQLDGAGKTVVMVTLESGEETIYAVDTQSGQMQNQETHVLLEDGSALEETTYLPAVCGVAVVCDGGGDVRVAARITELVRALLDLSANRICVEQRKG